MKNFKKKKGFTIIELVIVIAVIAILAAVLIPTFSNVISKANASAALQEANNAYKEALMDQDDAALDATATKIYVKQSGELYTFSLSTGVLKQESVAAGELPKAASAEDTKTTYIWIATKDKVVVEISATDYGQISDTTAKANYSKKAGS